MRVRNGLNGWLLLWACLLLPFAAHAAEGAHLCAAAVQCSEQGKNTDNPKIDPALEHYSKQLKGLGFGQYTQLGAGKSAVPAVGASSELPVGDYTLVLQTLKVEADGWSLNIVVKKGKEEICKNPMKVKPGVPALIGLDKPTLYVILRMDK